MFRSNLAVRTSRLMAMPCNRKFSTAKEKFEKFFIIDVKNNVKCEEKLSKVIHDHKTLSKVEQSQIKTDQWKRLTAIVNEIFENYKYRAVDYMKEMKIEKALNEVKKELKPEKLKEKLKDAKLTELIDKEKLKKIGDASMEQWQVIKTSEGFAKIFAVPTKSLKLMKDMTVKVQHHWIAFMDSPAYGKILHVVTIIFENAKKGTIELIKFIKHVYNAPAK